MIRSKIILVLAVAFTAGLIGILVWKINEDGSLSEKRTASTSDSLISVPRSSNELLSSAFSSIRSGSSLEKSRQSLADLRKSLTEMPRNEALAAIRGFLSSGQDLTTGLSFQIEKDGSLSEWPTFRAFLLDVLPLIDPAAAVSIGREVLTSPTNADEWALSLRNIARGEPLDGNASYLKSKTEELITNPAWQEKPSVAYLNAFDVLVHIEATESTPLLSNLVQRKDRGDLAHAGFLTLDRLVQRKPADLLNRLAADQSLQQSRPEMVAQQFARADVRDPQQREILKSWLIDPARTPVELRAFSGIYPNNNRFVSNNLLTVESSLSGADLSAHDRAALETITAWTNDADFQQVREHLELMATRLKGFIGSGVDAGAPDSTRSSE